MYFAPARSTLAIIVAVLSPPTAFAQFDRALDGPMNQLKGQYEQVVRAGDNKAGDLLLAAVRDFKKTTEDLLVFTEKTPASLGSANGISDLTEKAAGFHAVVKIMWERARDLGAKLDNRGADYSSEYSNLKSAYGEYLSKGEELNKLLYYAGRAMTVAMLPDAFGKFERGMESESPMADLKQQYDQVIRAGDNRDGEAIYKLIVPMTESLNKVYTLTEKLPATLGVFGISVMAEKATSLNSAIMTLRERANTLYQKTQSRGADFSSEYSNLKDAYGAYLSRGESLRTFLFPAGKAMREACAACMR